MCIVPIQAEQRPEIIASEENRPTDDYEEIDLEIRLRRSPCNVATPDTEVRGGNLYEKLSPKVDHRLYSSLRNVETAAAETTASDQLM